jgi:hypothetical protein
MGNDTIISAKMKETKNTPQSPEDLAKALGQVVTKPEAAVIPPTTSVQPAVTPATPDKPETRYEKLLKGLTPDQKAMVEALPEGHREKVAEGFFKATHAQGFLKEFTEQVLKAIAKIAEENLVKVDGYEFLARFPVGEGTVPNGEFATVGTYEAKNAKGEGKKKAGDGERKGWGNVEVLSAGKVISYKSLGDAANEAHENIKTQWAANMVEAFRQAGYTDIVDVADGHAIKTGETPQGHGVRMTRPS